MAGARPPPRLWRIHGPGREGELIAQLSGGRYVILRDGGDWAMLHALGE